MSDSGPSPPISATVNRPPYSSASARMRSRNGIISGCDLLCRACWKSEGRRHCRPLGSAGGLSRSWRSCIARLMASRRKPSTPRSNQNRMHWNSASCTAGLCTFKSGCSGRKLCMKYWQRRASQVHAEPPNSDCQLFGGVPSARASAHTYQSLRGLPRLVRLCWNQGCWSEVCESTWSMTTRRPSSCARASSRSKSARVPKIGSTSQ